MNMSVKASLFFVDLYSFRNMPESGMAES
jgi:hypothetical protein